MIDAPPQRSRWLPLSLAALACLCALLLLVAPPALAAEEEESSTTVTYTHESAAQYEKQLAAGEIAQAKINKFLRHLDMTLKNGQHFVYVYPKKGEPAVKAQLEGKGVSVTVLSSTAAKKEKPPVKHKLRYIAGGIIIVVIVIVGVVLFIDRRRKALAE